MKSTLIRRWQRTITSLHPPLQRTVRQSQRLLKLLNGSFRKELETYHPHTESYHVNTHLKSILENPLFSPRKKASYDIAGIMASIQSTHTSGLPVRDLQLALSSGHTKRESIMSVLGEHLRECKNNSSYKKLYSNEVAKLIVHWLHSSGLDRTFEFLQDHRLSDSIIRTLVANGDYSRVLSWFRLDDSRLRKLTQKLHHHHPSFIQSRILFDLVKAEVDLGAGTESALSIFHAYVKWARKMNTKPSCLQATFVPAGGYLMRHLRRRVQRNEVDVKHYDRFARSTDEWASRTGLERAWMNVYHPRYPDAQPTLQYLQKHIDFPCWMPFEKRKLIANMSVQAATVLLSQQQDAKAQWITQVLDEFYGDIVGTDKESLATGREETIELGGEWANLRSLESLAVG